MLQFIPFEDDWDALERMRPEDLVPYRVGLLPEPASSTLAVGVAASVPSRTPHPTAMRLPGGLAGG